MKITFLFFLIFEFLISGDLPLTFYPQFSARHFSSGSIYHHNKTGQSTLLRFGLGASKSEGAFSVIGLFQFTAAHNVANDATFFNPNLNIEMNRGFINREKSWFESSFLKITYKKDSFESSFGKYAQFWGYGHSSLILSQNAPSYPQAGFSWKMSSTLTLDYFLGSLSSQLVDSSLSQLYDNVGTRNTFFPRSIAAHRLVWKPSTIITFTAMESVIFGHRDFDIHYLQPFVPFWSMQHYTGDIDNVQMCGEVIWHIKNNLDSYASIFVDEWRPEWTFDKKNRNWFGYQVGFVGQGLIKEEDNLRLEYTWTDHRIYRHRFPINDAYSDDYSIGFWAGPHADETYMSYHIPLKNLTLDTYISHVNRGELTNQMLEDQYIEIQENLTIYNRYQNVKESRTIVSFLIKKEFFNDNILLEIGGEWIDWENAGFNPLLPNKEDVSHISKTSIQIGLTINTHELFH